LPAPNPAYISRSCPSQSIAHYDIYTSSPTWGESDVSNNSTILEYFHLAYRQPVGNDGYQFQLFLK
jgi:hypothetical protein